MPIVEPDVVLAGDYDLDAAIKVHVRHHMSCREYILQPIENMFYNGKGNFGLRPRTTSKLASR